MLRPDRMRIIDISPGVGPRTAVFPGDVPFERAVSRDFGRGDALELGSMRSTLHIGAHADAPSHYHPDGEGIDARDLGLYLGPATVVEVDVPPRTRLGPGHLGGGELKPRVLFKTSTFPDPRRWTGDFAALSPRLVSHLASLGTRLVGIDTPSIDLADDPALETHREVHRNDMAVLEGIVLEGVPPGDYLLCALPLKLEGADAAPVRAVLLEGT